MAQLIKKENITIVTGTYNDAQGNEKKRYKTIAELITMKGDDGSEYQFGEIWGPHGVTKFNVYAQEDNNNNQQQNNNQGQQQQQNNGGFQQQQNNHQNNNNGNNGGWNQQGHQQNNNGQ
jgi:hypothetical protein